MTATVHPIFPDPKRAQQIADSHGLILLADGTMVREYRYDAGSVSDAIFVGLVEDYRHLLSQVRALSADPDGPRAA